tara:strand:+ start:247 stop:435 length:189 start_codon:yes stop_codon:yes gene_type:complete
MKNWNTRTPTFLAGLINNTTQLETFPVLEGLIVRYWNDNKICPSDRTKLTEMIAAKKKHLKG